MSGGGKGVGRFYRSRLFWLGVPGLVFLLWVWWDSGKDESEARWVRADGLTLVRTAGGQLEWVRTKDPTGSIPYLTLFEPFSLSRSVRREEVPIELLWKKKGKPRGRQFDFPAAFGKEDEWIARSSLMGGVYKMGWHVALWVIVAGYVAVWLGAACWWQLHKARVMKDLTDVEVVA